MKSPVREFVRMLTRLCYWWHVPVPKFVQRFAHIRITSDGGFPAWRYWEYDWPAYEKELSDNHLRHYLRNKGRK